MALFTERRIAHNPAMIPPTGDRRGSRDANRDPITGAPGAHPLGTGIGAAAGGMAAGAAAGSVAGPAGAVAGAAVGAIAGGLAGKGIAELIDPTVEEAYWRSNYMREPYYERGYNFEDYYPAYRTGWEGRVRYQHRQFDEVERDLARDYQRNRGSSRLEWAKNRHAARAAWERFEGPDFTERSQ
jgi:flavin-dependent dehydrogenase